MLSTNVITKKPTILVAVLEGANPSVVEQIGYGMEEEGIPFDFYEHSFRWRVQRLMRQHWTPL